MIINDYVQLLLKMIQNSDRRSATSLIDKAISEQIPHQIIIEEILDPVLVQMGTMWGKGEVSLAQTFVGAKIAEDILLKCIPKEGNLIKPKGKLIIGNIEDDFHSLGRRVVSSFLKASGWEIIDLGNDVLPEVFLDTAIKENVHLIAVSAMMQTTAMNILKLRHLIDQKGYKNKIMLAVGGAVFNWKPELLDLVGADGTAQNASAVDPMLMDLLSKIAN